MFSYGPDGLRPQWGDDNVTRNGIIGVGAHFMLQPHLKHRFLLGGYIGITFMVGCIRKVIEDVHRFAVQPVGRPVGSNIGAMAPYRSHFLSPDGLPHILSVFDILARKQHGPGRGHHLRRDRRSLFVNFPPIIDQD